MLVGTIAVLDELLDTHATALGGDFTAYRNHAYRVANLCLMAAGPDADAVTKVGIAAALHDMGIWTDDTFDYLEPSCRLARAHLAAAGLGGWTDEIVAMILEHHKITRYRGRSDWLVEPFRRADWTDVTAGVFAFGVPRPAIRALYARFPDAGFHRLLVRLELRHLARHPLNPLPVLRL